MNCSNASRGGVGGSVQCEHLEKRAVRREEAAIDLKGEDAVLFTANEGTAISATYLAVKRSLSASKDRARAYSIQRRKRSVRCRPYRTDRVASRRAGATIGGWLTPLRRLGDDRRSPRSRACAARGVSTREKGQFMIQRLDHETRVRTPRVTKVRDSVRERTGFVAARSPSLAARRRTWAARACFRRRRRVRARARFRAAII